MPSSFPAEHQHEHIKEDRKLVILETRPSTPNRAKRRSNRVSRRASKKATTQREIADLQPPTDAVVAPRLGVSAATVDLSSASLIVTEFLEKSPNNHKVSWPIRFRPKVQCPVGSSQRRTPLKCSNHWFTKLFACSRISETSSGVAASE